MGKCISKHPSSLTITTLSEKDLATAKQIASNFIESQVEPSAICHTSSTSSGKGTAATNNCNNNNNNDANDIKGNSNNEGTSSSNNGNDSGNSNGNGNQLCKYHCVPNNNNSDGTITNEKHHQQQQQQNHQQQQSHQQHQQQLQTQQHQQQEQQQPLQQQKQYEQIPKRCKAMFVAKIEYDDCDDAVIVADDDSDNGEKTAQTDDVPTQQKLQQQRQHHQEPQPQQYQLLLSRNTMKNSSNKNNNISNNNNNTSHKYKHNIIQSDCWINEEQRILPNEQQKRQHQQRQQQQQQWQQEQQYIVTNNYKNNVENDENEIHFVNVQQLQQFNTLLKVRQNTNNKSGNQPGILFISLHEDDGAASLVDGGNNNNEDDEFILLIEEKPKGQAESKKFGKKDGVETKGTAMSFGFRKKLNTTPKKLKKLIEGESKRKQDKCNNIKASLTSSTESNTDGVDGTLVGGNTTTTTVIGDMAAFKDDNGNAETMPKVYFEKMGAAAKSNNAPGNVCQGTTPISTTSQTATPTSAPSAVAAAVVTPTAAYAAAAADCTVNRFGFRGVARPASAGNATKYQQDISDNLVNNNNSINNNNNNNNNGGGVGGGASDVGQSSCNTTTTPGLVSNLKRRSKSAHAGRSSGESDNSETSASATRPTQPKTITFNLKQNSTIEYQRQQFFQQPPANTNGRTPPSAAAFGTQRHAQFVNSGLHTNVIVRPMPRTPAVAYSKFTLHTVSLPRPEFPVAISLGVGTPGTPGSSYTPSPMAPAGGNPSKHPLTAVTQQQQQQPHSNMDSKSVKQMANNTRRGFTGSREISADSGIASMDMALDSSHSSSVSASSSAGRRMRHDSPKRSRSRPRNLQMVMNGRHKFEVRDLDDPPSSESSSFVETLALPKLPTEDQTTPLPLSGLVRSNTVLSRENSELKKSTQTQESMQVNVVKNEPVVRTEVQRIASYEKASVEEEKLSKDRSASEKNSKTFTVAKSGSGMEDNTISSRTSSPASSIMSSWCNGVSESLALKDCSSITLYSSEPTTASTKQMTDMEKKIALLTLELDDEEISLVNTDMQTSTISSFTESAPQVELQCAARKGDLEQDNSNQKPERPKSLYEKDDLTETKFAEMALAGSTYLLDDETSPTDSLVSSTASDEMAVKLKKHKINEELQEKDIDEISPELEAISSPISHSFSLSDCGNLIDDEIADQPGLLCNQDPHDPHDPHDPLDGLESSLTSRKDKTDTPTLMESEITANTSLRSLKNQSKARTALHQAIELSLRTPLSLRKAVMERAESLDTLSPCESICSDDLMMDFDLNSSMDSIDRSASIKSRSGTDLHKINIDDTELFSELENKGSDVMRELNTILRVHNNRKTEKESIIAKLPARATRLLNRSRLQQQQQRQLAQCPSMFGSATISGVVAPTAAADSDSSTRSPHSLRRSQASSRASSASVNISTRQRSHHHNHHQQQPHQQHQHQSHHPQQQQQHQNQQAHNNHQLHQQHRDSYSSSDDLMLYDKSFRNAMIQDVLQFKKQLLRLRRILQEEEDCLTRTETLNPFENDNGKLFATCGLDSKQLDDIDLASLTSSTTDDPVQELAEIRRQVVYLQSQVDERDRTIRLQRNLIEKLEAEKKALSTTNGETPRECISMATQTERTRPLSVAAEGLSRSKPQYTSYTTHFPLNLIESTTVIQEQHHPPEQDKQQQQHHQQQLDNNQKKTRRHTIISTTLTNYNHQVTANYGAGIGPRRASIAWENPKQLPIYKPVRITLIGEPLKLLNDEMNGEKLLNDWTKKCDEATKKDASHNGVSGSREVSVSVANGITNGTANGVTNGVANGITNGIVNGVTNGVAIGGDKLNSLNCGKSIIKGDLKHVYQQLENNNHNNCNVRNALQQQQQQQHQQLQQQQKHLLHNRTQKNGNLYPTVTIV